MNSPKVTDTYLGKKKKLIDRELLNILRKIQPVSISPRDFKESTLHSVLEGGKRIRPILAIAVYEACGGKGRRILAPACTVELIHAGSLMLDDLPCMDNADMRRGKATTHKLFGESTTILASAALWAAAFEIISVTSTSYMAELIHQMSLTIGGRGLIQGQMLDLESFNTVQNTKELEECYRLKTGVLFALSMSIGASLADADKKLVKKYSQLGERLGIAFQIRDDILDATKSLDEIGKDPHLDTKNHKPNYVSLLGLSQAHAELDRHTRKLQTELVKMPGDTELLSQIIDTMLLV